MIKVRVHEKNNWLKDAGYTQEEEASIYDAQLQDVLDNPRWYLDNCETVMSYRVSWINYSRDKITLPLKLLRFRAPNKLK